MSSIFVRPSVGVLLDSNDTKQIEYRNAIHGFTPILVKPWLFVEPIFICSSFYRMQCKLLKVLHKFTTNVIEEREKRDMIHSQWDSHSH
ncbi:hypothetical protein CBL_08376 [Carabus blaptoides fortunei]